MTSIQKAIKYLAIAFALFLTVSIIGGILSAVSLTTFILGGDSVVGESMSYPIENTSIDSLDIEIKAGTLNIISADEFRVESNHKRLKVEVDNGCLEIKENDSFIGLKTVDIKTNVYIPKDLVFEKASIETNAGRMIADTLTANSVTLMLGTGESTINCLNANKKATIDGGVGMLTINSGTLNNLEADMGVGALDMTAKINGNSSIDHGIGALTLKLKGDADDYFIELNKGIGNAIIDGEKYSDGSTFGNGSNVIELDGGIGEIKVNFVKE